MDPKFLFLAIAFADIATNGYSIHLFGITIANAIAKSSVLLTY